MTKLYSPSTKGFYDESIHGLRMISIPDPAFVRPKIEVPDLEWDSPGSSEDERPLILVDDMDAIAESIEVRNPSCVIPLDALEITQELYESLFAQQAAGKVIQPGPDGSPVATDQPPPTSEAVRRMRDALISVTDWTQLGDVPAATKTAWKSYRQALRDVPEQAGFPVDVVWPVSPA